MSKYLSLIPLLVLLSACATPAQVSGMIAAPATQLDAQSPLQSAVSVGEIVGGERTNPLMMSEVGNAEFQEALSQTLDAYGMLAPGNARFRLDATLVGVYQPAVSFDTTVGSTVDYRLSEVATNQIVFQQEVTESYTVKVAEEFVGVNRLRLANEGSIRTNIGAFIEALRTTIGTDYQIAGVVAEPAREAAEASATLYVFNISGPTLFGGNYDVLDGTKTIASLPRRNYAIRQIAPGTHIIQMAAEGSSSPIKLVELNAAASGTYYISFGYDPGASWAFPFAGDPTSMEIISQEEAAQLLNEYSHVE